MDRRDFFRALLTLVLGSWLGAWEKLLNWLSRRTVRFDRIVLPKFTKEVDELRTWREMDIRKILSDNCIRDMQEESMQPFLGRSFPIETITVRRGQWSSQS
jgi:hypothetical protein